MVRQSAPKRKNPNYFFWDGKLHKVLRVNRPVNLVEAWCFPDRKSVSLLYSDYRDRAKVAVQTGRAAEIMRVTPRSLFRYTAQGSIHPPAESYALDGHFGEAEPGAAWNEGKTVLWWGEHNLMELHDFLMTISRGFQRKDGQPSPLQRTPTKAEIRAAFNNSTTLYVKGTSGDYVPIFSQPNW